MLGFLRETPWVLRGEGDLHTLINYRLIEHRYRTYLVSTGAVRTRA